MKVVRQRMIKPLQSKLPIGMLLIISLLGILTSCNPTEITAKNARGNVVNNTDGSLDNKAYVYEDSPYYLAGPNYGPGNVNMGPMLAREAKLITTNNQLTGNCSMMFAMPVTLQDCIHVLENASATTQPLPRKSDRTFIFNTNSKEFYQTNTLYLVSKGSNTFFDKLKFAYDQSQSLMGLYVPKSIPYYLMSSQMFWFKAMANTDKKEFNTDYLTVYAQCELESNAAFYSAGPSLCFGSIKDLPGFYMVQDPSVVYHELGHAFVSVLLNMRNGTSTLDYHPFRSNMSGLGFNEASSINEGLADYFSYIMLKRERVGEFALGRTINQARPLSESDALHSIPSIAETSEGRLSYPQYLLYDPNNPDSPFEDVHYAGQIVTHYLVALSKNLKTTCNLTGLADGGHDKVTSWVMLLVAETLSELGDLNAKGVDYFTMPWGGTYNFNNFDKTNSYLWTHFNNRISYRRFFQVFSKNIQKFISYNDPFLGRTGLCTAFDKNKSEKLLDDYGLLLFKTYNDNGTSTKDRTVDYSAVPSLQAQPLTAVSESNRRKSVLISKQLLDIVSSNDTANRVVSYVIDNSSEINDYLQNLLFKGVTVPVTQNVAGTVFNNSNGRISPGEVVAIIPNLLNNSNSTMAGVQLLATDWDHASFDETTGNYKPCVVDTTTTVDQGGESSGSCTTTSTEYNRSIGLKDTTTGKYKTDLVAPVCMVQMEDGTSTKWVSQNEFRKKQGLTLLDKDCLGYTTTGTTDQDFSFNPHECLIRFLPGGEIASYSKIDAQKTFYDSVVKETKSFNVGNTLLLEVNKWIPPGTKFRCRMRARFSNCSDCYTDGTNANDDYADYEYNGQKPFKVINFDFEVND